MVNLELQLSEIKCPLTHTRPHTWDSGHRGLSHRSGLREISATGFDHVCQVQHDCNSPKKAMEAVLAIVLIHTSQLYGDFNVSTPTNIVAGEGYKNIVGGSSVTSTYDTVSYLWNQVLLVLQFTFTYNCGLFRLV